MLTVTLALIRPDAETPNDKRETLQTPRLLRRRNCSQTQICWIISCSFTLWKSAQTGGDPPSFKRAGRACPTAPDWIPPRFSISSSCNRRLSTSQLSLPLLPSSSLPRNYPPNRSRISH